MNQFSAPTNKRSVCFVHDWLTGMRGGEKVLEYLTELFPEAPIYTLFYDRSRLSPTLRSKTIHGSFLQLIPGIQQFYRWLLPVFPFAIRTFQLKHYDLVISKMFRGSPVDEQDCLSLIRAHRQRFDLKRFEAQYRETAKYEINEQKALDTLDLLLEKIRQG